MMIPDHALNALKDRMPVDAVASQWVALRKKGKGYVGPCPICSPDPQSADAMRFECDSNRWICAVCHDAGDVIKLTMLREGISFRDAIERLGGARDEAPTPKLARAAGLRAFHGSAGPMPDVPAPYDTDPALRVAWCAGWTDGRKQQQDNAVYRERERRHLYDDFWRPAVRWPGTPVEAYLQQARGLSVPPNAKLRFHPMMPMFADGSTKNRRLLHRGMAMLAPFLDAAGTFRGLHITWLDPSGPKGKAAIFDPVKQVVMPSKKMRGTKSGCYIDLGGSREPTRIVSGEGNETVLAGYTGLLRAGRNVSSTAFRAAGDLGNLAGKALKTIAHPTLKDRGGKPQRVPGPEPDLESSAMPIPETVTELVLLGDGDSEPVLTHYAMERAKHRHARPGRLIRTPFAPVGLDFNDVLQGKTSD
jgi:hypothetical protein